MEATAPVLAVTDTGVLQKKLEEVRANFLQNRRNSEEKWLFERSGRERYKPLDRDRFPQKTPAVAVPAERGLGEVLDPPFVKRVDKVPFDEVRVQAKREIENLLQ
jgi:hypothetical protein